MAGRACDIVLWGATGATGRRAAHHLAQRCRECGLRFAIGGRNRKKLKALRDDLSNPENPIAVLVGDSHDTAFMAAMSAKTRVVASTVGPFALYGSELVAACAQNGTHYCDLTAEPQWIGGGFWTPAAAMGNLLRDRITAHAGLSFEIVDICGS